MRDFYHAVKQLIDSVEPIQNIEYVPLIDGLNRVIATDLMINYDAPLFDNSAMDGYAISGLLSTSWEVVDRIIAGDVVNNKTLQAGECCRIFTGAPVPLGANAVIPQENVRLNNKHITLNITNTLKDGANIRVKAEELQTGNLLASTGSFITPTLIGLLASQGYNEVPVYRKLKAGVFSTGNELINADEFPTAGKIFDANRPLIASLLKNAAYDVQDGGIIKDNLDETMKAIAQLAEKNDVIICTGGVSVGEEDHLKQALSELGELNVWQLAIKPGKLFAWGKIKSTHVFLLPGNPVSSFVHFKLLVLPALKRISGIARTLVENKFYYARTSFSMHKKIANREFLRVKMNNQFSNEIQIQLLTHQGANMLSTCVLADCFAEIPANTLINQGDWVKIYPF